MPYLDALKKHFQYDAFLEGQETVVDRIMGGEDLLVIMPTGAGKSLCYQLPAMMKDGYTLVLSPLISLMKDQVDALNEKRMPAAFINSTLTTGQRHATMNALRDGCVRLLYVAPERLRIAEFVNIVRTMPPAYLVVDEAHCISQWGHDFRPDYARIGRFIDELGIAQVCGFTATATPVVKEDIGKQLQRPGMQAFITGFTRPNLSFSVVSAQTNGEKLDFLEQQLRTPQPTIIYASTRKNVELVADTFKCISYHAGINDEMRTQAQNRFTADECPIIAATNAFGMGIDRPDIRRVIHFNIPGSIEAYYQEAGRAGRDGEDAECTLLFSYQDRFIHEFLIELNNPPPFVVLATYQTLLQLSAERGSPHLESSLAELSDLVPGAMGDRQIGAALKILEKNDLLFRGFRDQNKGVLRLLRPAPELLLLYPEESTQRAIFVRRTVQHYGSRLDHGVTCTHLELQQTSGLTDEQVRRVLRALTGTDILWTPPFTGRGLTLADPSIRDPQIDFDEYQRNADLETQRLDEMMAYPQSRGCRQRQLISYFGQRVNGWVCRVCDECRGASSRETRQPTAVESDVIITILKGVQELGGRFGKNRVVQFLNGSRSLEITRARLFRHPSHGALADRDQGYILKMIKSLVDAQCLMVVGESRYPLITLTPLGRDVMEERTTIELEFQSMKSTRAEGQRRKSSKPSSHGRQAAAVAVGEGSPSFEAGVDDLFERLCQLRNAIAEKRRLVPYQVFSNRTLRELVDRTPLTVEEARVIHGVGAKTERTVLPEFLGEIERWRRENGMPF